jgi:nitroreductase
MAGFQPAIFIESARQACPAEDPMNVDPGQSRSSTIDPAVAAAIRGRRTIASFSPETPPRDVIMEAIDLARWAPNHKKTEPWHVIWLGPESIRQVIEINTRILTESKGAAEAESKGRKWSQVPGWLVVTCDLAPDAFRREEDYAACCCAIQNLQLALWSAGIGTKWATGDVTRHPDFFNLLQIDPQQQRVVGLVWYGYPAVVPEQTRRPVETFLREVR